MDLRQLQLSVGATLAKPRDVVRYPSGSQRGSEPESKLNITMQPSKLLLLGACCLALAGSPLLAQDSNGKPKLNLLKGPAKAHLGNVAQIDVPLNYVFINGKDYQKLLKAEGEPVSGRELGCLTPTNEDWSVVFKFSDIGYVKDDDKELNADKLLDSIKRGTAAANKERERQGTPPIEVVGWEVPPKYDPTTHNLEWAIRGMVEGLAARLKQQGGSAEDWAKLVRSYAVLGESDKARAALAAARAALPDQAAQATLAQVARASGLEAAP